MSITHSKVSGVPNPADPTLVGGEDWDDDHVIALADGDIPATIARDAEVDTKVTTHAGAADPHGDRADATTKANAAQAAAIAAAATDATTKANAAQAAAIAASDPAGSAAAVTTTSIGAVPTTRTVSAGTGLTGGGDLSANRTLASDFGTGAGKVTQGNDSRLTDARTPTGAAGGDLSGTYPNPSVTDDSHSHTAATLPAAGADLSGVDFLVGTASGLLSAEIPVGTSPGGELGGTWASPTVDATHSGSTHAATQAAAEATAAGALSTHAGAADPHPGYLTPAEGNAAYSAIGAYAPSGTDVAVADGGTGASTAANARTNLGLVIGTDVRAQGSGDPTRASLGLATSDSPEFAALNVGAAADTTITRTGVGDIAVEGNALYRAGGTDVPIADGGTGSSTASAAVDALGGASSTGTGGLVRATSPTLVTPLLGTPTSGVATNLTGTAAGLTAGTVTTNANLTGDVTSSGNATTIGSGKVTEAMQVLADNTTQDVSTSKHGYAPKGDGTTTKFLNANGAYSTPAGAPAAFIGCRLTRVAAQSITSNSLTEIAFDTEDFDTDTMHYTSSANLTGTLAKTASSTAVVGTTTAFTTELSVGQVISVPGTATERRVVTAIADNTHLTVNANFANTASGQTAARVSAAIVFRTAGYYHIDARGTLVSSNTLDRVIQIMLQSGTTAAFAYTSGVIASPAANGGTATIGDVIHAAQWDFVTMQFYQLTGSTGNTNTTAGYYPMLTVSLMGT